jgi:hypothetical protein
MAAIDILRSFRRVQPRSGTVDVREFVEMQQRLEQAIDSLVKFNRTVAPAGLCCTAKLTASQISKYFDDTGLGVAGQPWEGWAIRNGNNGTDDADGRFPRYSTTESGGTGGSDSSAHTHTTPAHQHVLPMGFDGTNFRVQGDGSNAPVYGSETEAGMNRAQISYDVGFASGSVRRAYTKSDGSGTTGAASVTDNRPAYIHEVPVMRL